MEVRPLHAKLQEKAIKELNEDPRRTEEAFEHIRDWLRKQPHLNVRNDDQIMIAFFRGCKWNLQIVKQKLDYFYSIKNQIPELFRDRDPLSPGIQNALKAGIIFPLPKLENHFGPIIILYRFTNVDVNEIPLVETLKLFFMTMDILLREDDDFVVSGLCVLTDHYHCPTEYYLQFTPTAMKNCFVCVQKAYPLRIKSVPIVNTLKAFEALYNAVFKPYLSEKLRSRFRVLNVQNSKKFFSEYPKNVLPEEYGGTNGSLRDAAENWKNKVESYREWFLEDKEYFTNENLRIGNTSVLENDIGIDGTFRNLAID